MKKFALSLFTLGLILIPATGWTASVLKMDLDDLTLRSDLALVGKVVAISHQNLEDRYPETLYTVNVISTFYGEEADDQVTLCLPGGPAGNGLTTYVPGMPKFKMDEKVALFLVMDADRNVAVPTGLEQGVFRIKIHPETEEEYLVNQNIPINIDEDAGSKTKTPGSKSLSLSKFKKIVKEKAVKLKKDK